MATALWTASQEPLGKKAGENFRHTKIWTRTPTTVRNAGARNRYGMRGQRGPRALPLVRQEHTKGAAHSLEDALENSANHRPETQRKLEFATKLFLVVCTFSYLEKKNFVLLELCGTNSHNFQPRGVIGRLGVLAA